MVIMANDTDTNTGTATIRFEGDRRCQDNVVRFHWDPGQEHDIPEDKAAQLLTNGHFIRVDDEPCSQKSRHTVYSKDNEPCPECGQDKWVDPVDEDSEEYVALDSLGDVDTEDYQED